ncbi:N-methylhydantoinase A/oxoprolinase/acetone carboxylase beta subunit [Bradyrhizobium liaoningense]
MSTGTRTCSFDGLHQTPTAIIDRASLTEMVSGPAIIEDAWSTVVVPPGWQAKPDVSGNLFLTRREA